MTTYVAIAERSDRTGGWWAIEVPELPGVFSQAKRLEQVSGMARDAVAAFLDVSPDSVDIEVRPRLAEDLEALVTRAKRVREVAELMQREALDVTRAAVIGLDGAGLTVRDIGRVVGLSHQRVAQILAEPADVAPTNLVDLMAALEASVNAARLARPETSAPATAAGHRRPRLKAAG
jgi:predicted RNase H-like HicB family nuclease